MNKVYILGRLGKDPSGEKVVNFSVATTERWTDQQGQKQERTEWHNVACFGKTGEIALKYLQKGDQVLIEGKLRTDKYTDKDGVEKYSTKVICDQLHLLGGRSEQSNTKPANKATASEDAPFDDEVPF